MNKIILVGNLTADPEGGATSNGVAYCRFSVAVNRDYTNADGDRDCDFFNVTVWRGRAESCTKYLKKGKKVAVCGSMQSRTYEDKDGIKRYAFDVVAEEVEFLSPSGSSESSGPAGSDRYDKPQEKPQLEPVSDNQLPF